MHWEHDWRKAEKVLCVRLDTVGDVLMTTPAMKALKETNPSRRLTLLTSTRGAAIAPLVPEIDEVLVYDPPWMKATAPRRDASVDRQTIEALRSREFDGAIVFTVYSQNPQPAALLCYLADIPLRLAHSRENPYGMLSHWVSEPEPDHFIRHEVRRQLDLVGQIGCRSSDERISMGVPPEARRRALRLLARKRVDLTEPWVVVHTGSSAPSRTYPRKSFAELLRVLSKKGVQTVLTGTRRERAAIDEIRVCSGVHSVSLAGLLDLGELAAVLELAPLLVTNNTGPAHIASAVGTPIVDLYALTNPQHTPWAVPHRVLNKDTDCKYCYRSVCPEGHHRCLKGVTAQEVAKATLALLAETAPRIDTEVAA